MLNWVAPVGTGLATIVAAQAATTPTSAIDWPMLGAVGGLVTIIVSAANAWFGRSVRAEIGASEVRQMAHVKREVGELRIDVARRDVTDIKFAEIERRLLAAENARAPRRSGESADA